MTRSAHRHRGWRAAPLSLLALALACSAPGTERAPADSPAAVAGAGTASAGSPVATAELPVVTVYKSPTCGCCNAWVDHMRENGFRVVAVDTNDLDAVKASHGIRPEHGSCHTATVGDYVVEGHVPASDVRRLLSERPSVAGLAVPGMPMGSPGMEGPRSERYDVLAFERSGAARVFATH